MPEAVRTFKSFWPALMKLGCLVCLILAANFAVDWVIQTLNFEIRPSNEDFVHKSIMISAIAYILLIAIPFVPGIEIGLILIGIFGAPIIALVYMSTLTGLMFSFLLGRLISLHYLIDFFDGLRLFKLSELLRTIAPMSMQDRLALLVSRTPNRIVPLMLRHRYVALAVTVNVPGNAVIGGGGGIALVAGISRLFTIPGFLITIAIAIAPLPLAVYLFGKDILP